MLGRFVSLREKVATFRQRPHIPWVVEKRLREHWPKLHRLIKYRTTDPTSKKYWDGVWTEEGATTWRTYPNLFSVICGRLRPNLRVLDVGCGPGVLLTWIKERVSPHCFGLDMSEVAVRLLKNQKMPGVVAQLPGIPFKDASFDAVIATEVIEHVHDPTRTLAEMCRVAKVGGLVVFSVPNECMTTDECDEHLHDFDRETVLAMVQGRGEVEVLDIEDKGGARLLAVIRKPAPCLPQDRES